LIVTHSELAKAERRRLTTYINMPVTAAIDRRQRKRSSLHTESSSQWFSATMFVSIHPAAMLMILWIAVFASGVFSVPPSAAFAVPQEPKPVNPAFQRI